MKIGSLAKNTFANLRPSGSRAAEAALEAPRDLVEIAGSSCAARRRALKNASRFAVTTGLPLVATAAGGLPGLIAGTALAGAATTWTSRQAELSGRLSEGVKQAALVAGGGALLSLADLAWSGLGPVLAVGAAVAGTAAAGFLEYEAARGPAHFEVNLNKLASGYQQAAARELEQAGHAQAAAKVQSLAPGRSHEQAQLALAQTALLTSHHLSPAVAMGLVRELGRRRTDLELLSQLDGDPEDTQLVSSEVYGGIKVRRLEGLEENAGHSAQAGYAQILLDDRFQVGQGDPLSDFVFGHEKSHIEHRDNAARIAGNALQEAVVASFGRGPLAGQLFLAARRQTHEVEKRCDKDGLLFAQAQGHSRDSVLAAAEELFSIKADATKNEHPEAAQRMLSLKDEASLSVASA